MKSGVTRSNLLPQSVSPAAGLYEQKFTVQPKPLTIARTDWGLGQTPSASDDDVPRALGLETSNGQLLLPCYEDRSKEKEI